MKPKVKVCLCGCGSITDAWLPAIRSVGRIELVGLVDLLPESIERLRKKWDLDRVPGFSDLAVAIGKTQPDAVFDLTVPSVHKVVVATALRAGCHVLGEKPMSDDMASARKLLKLARERKRIYAIIQNRRYRDGIVAFRKLVQSGRIGEITSIHNDFFVGMHFNHAREKWNHSLLLDMAVHAFDEARFITGTEPVACYAEDWVPRDSWFSGQSNAVAFFEMTGGVKFTYRGAWDAEGLWHPSNNMWRVVGTRGMAIWDGEGKIRAGVAGKSNAFIRETRELKVPLPKKLKHTGHAGVIHDFVTALLGGPAPQTIAADNIKSLAMVHAAIRSAESGRRTKVLVGELRA